MNETPSPAAHRTRISLALLECDHVDPDLRAIAGDYGDMFAARFGAEAPGIDLDRIDVIGGEALPAAGEHDGMVITGSRRSATEDLDWMLDLGSLVRAAYRQGVRVAGICFGHQLIAHAMGGRVGRAETGWGVGVHEATILGRRPWMDPPRSHLRLLMSHQDQVTSLPAGAAVLASSPHAPVAAFELGSLIGVQGHPEFDAPYLEALMGGRVERIGADVVRRARGTLAVPHDGAVVARWLHRWFLDDPR